MEIEEYRLMFDLEETHWWYHGLHDLIFASIQKAFNDKSKINILDAGCGTGYVLQCLKKYGPSFGIDISETALQYCQLRNLNKISQATILKLPFRDESFDLLVSTDVLYHKKVLEDAQAINEMHRILKKNGILIINLPAFDNLRRSHDERVHTRHRYTKNEVYQKLKKNNFKIIKITYRNTFLFPILLLSMFANKKTSKKTYTGLKPLPNPINTLLYSFLRLENALLKNFNFPFGLSIYCVSKKH